MALGVKRRRPIDASVGVRAADDQTAEELARTAEPSPSRCPAGRPGSPASSAESASHGRGVPRVAGLSARIETLVHAIQDNDEARIEEAILRLIVLC